MSISSRMPWQAKIAAKIVLSRLPIPYQTWSNLNLFKHGAMRDVKYARDVFDRHFQRSRMTARGFTCLELGPGDSLMSALFARAAGASRTYIVDTGPYASRDVALYRAAAAEIFRGKADAPDPSRWTSIEAMLDDCRASYLVDGLASLRSLPTASVDWSWSQAVLEHVKRAEFSATMAELRRVTRKGGTTSHRIDFQDHLGGRLNSLRFSEATWEGDLFSRSGFYTNRLRQSEVIAAATRAGFEVVELNPDLWPALPTPRAAMHQSFRHFDDEDLRTRWTDLVLVAA